MTVNDLIKRLQQLPGDMDIFIDADGDTLPEMDIATVHDGDEVLGYCITRTPPADDSSEPVQMDLPFDSPEDTKGNK